MVCDIFLCLPPPPTTVLSPSFTLIQICLVRTFEPTSPTVAKERSQGTVVCSPGYTSSVVIPCLLNMYFWVYNQVIFWSQCSLLIIKDFLFWKTHSFCPWTWQEPFSCIATQVASYHHGWLRLALWKLPFCYITEDDREHRPVLDCEFQMPEPNKYQKVEAPPWSPCVKGQRASPAGTLMLLLCPPQLRRDTPPCLLFVVDEVGRENLQMGTGVCFWIEAV